MAKAKSEEIFEEEIKEEVKEEPKKNEEVNNEPVLTPAEKVKKHLNEKVKYTFPWLEGKDEDEQMLYIAVNGKNFVIHRGDEVTVPRYVVKVFENMRAQDMKLRAFNRKAQADFDKLNKELG